MSQVHAQSSDEVLAAFGVDAPRGLSAGEVERRRERHGPNELRRREQRSLGSILADQFKSVIVVLLLAAGVAAAVLGETVEAVAVLAAVVVNTAIGFVTELRARRSVDALRELGRTTARVRRDGDEREVPERALVPGDVVLLDEGDVVPADLRLVTTSSLRVDESALTGESVPVDKTTDAVAGEAPLAERSGMVFKGTAVTGGSGAGVVVATAMDTEIGAVAELASGAGEDEAPLERRLDALGRALVLAVVGVAAMVGVAGVAAGQPVRQMVETAIALAVAAVPEGLAIVATLALARGVLRMARRRAVVKRLASVETLGAVNAIFSDKTGTLTRGRMRVRRLVLVGDGEPRTVEVGDGGPRLEGGRRVEHDPVLAGALTVGALCGNARLAAGDGEDGGDPMEVALARAASAAGLAPAELAERHPRRREEAFSRDTKMMATFHEAGDGGKLLVAVKGAPEAVLAACTHVAGPDGDRPLPDGERERWAERDERLASGGLRVLGLARKHAGDVEAPPYEALAFLGLAGLGDPPREAAVRAVADCRRAGIRVVMVTGDHPATAWAIAEQAGIVDAEHPDAVTGADVPRVEDWSREDRSRLLRAAVFARLDPGQKLDLVELYQGEGRIVGMTGDGVNDAPALEAADIGIAMGGRGTQVARDAADMVLQDDAFDTIVDAVAQGRTLFGNIRRFIVYLLSGNLAEILAVAVAAVIGAPLPLLPLQILYINFVSDVFPAVGLGLGRGDERVLERDPRDPGEPILTHRLWAVVGGWAALIGAVTLGVFAAAFALGWSEERAVTASFLTFVLARLVHVLNMRDPDPSLRALVDNRVVRTPVVWLMLGVSAAILLAGVYVPVLARVLRLEVTGFGEWGLALAGAALVLALGQAAKLLGARLG